MFTGLIKEIGRIRKITGKGQDREIEIKCIGILNDLNAGDSISSGKPRARQVMFQRP